MKISKKKTDLDLLGRLYAGEFDHLDFGCGAGGSIAWAHKQLRAQRSLGIDNNPTKVAAATEIGVNAVQADILALPDEPLVQVVTLIHMLEHIPDRAVAQAMLRKANVLARSVAIVRQPFFDLDGYLFSLGLKLTWSDWRGHPSCWSSLEMFKMCRAIRMESPTTHFAIGFAQPITEWDDRAVVSLDAPVDTLRYHPKQGDRRLPKTKPKNLYRETVVVLGRHDTKIIRSMHACRASRVIFRSWDHH